MFAENFTSQYRKTLSLIQAADFLGINKETLRRRAKHDEIPGAKVGKCWRFLEEDLVSYLRSLYPCPSLSGIAGCQSKEKNTMALYKRNKIYWIDITHCGKRLQRSTRTSDKIAAQELHDKLKMELWRQSRLDEKPERNWMEAAMRWIDESSHKHSLVDDKSHLRWLDHYFRDLSLTDINRDLIQQVSKAKQETGVSAATVNRLLALIRAILNKAVHEWE